MSKFGPSREWRLQDYPQRHVLTGLLGIRPGREDFALGFAAVDPLASPNRPESLVVLRRAVEVDPRDTTLTFLLGSLLLGGQSDAALGEWEKAREGPDPKLPSSTATSLTLLYARGAAAPAVRVFEEGMAADPTNVELYQGADQALTLSRAPRSGSPRCTSPRDAAAFGTRLQAGARPRRGGALLRGGDALPGALLPA